jgi:hypothetical protein
MGTRCTSSALKKSPRSLVERLNGFASTSGAAFDGSGFHAAAFGALRAANLRAFSAAAASSASWRSRAAFAMSWRSTPDRLNGRGVVTGRGSAKAPTEARDDFDADDGTGRALNVAKASVGAAGGGRVAARWEVTNLGDCGRVIRRGVCAFSPDALYDGIGRALKLARAGSDDTDVTDVDDSPASEGRRFAMLPMPERLNSANWVGGGRWTRGTPTSPDDSSTRFDTFCALNLGTAAKASASSWADDLGGGRAGRLSDSNANDFERVIVRGFDAEKVGAPHVSRADAGRERKRPGVLAKFFTASPNSGSGDAWREPVGDVGADRDAVVSSNSSGIVSCAVERAGSCAFAPGSAST